jgi:hypothetical protein
VIRLAAFTKVAQKSFLGAVMKKDLRSHSVQVLQLSYSASL